MALGLSVSSLAHPACTPEPESPFTVRYETERLRIGSTFAEEICVAFLEIWEAHLDAIERELGTSRELAWLYLYDEATQELATDCSPSAESNLIAGCWDDPIARATLGLVAHELVHAWTAPVNRNPLPLLQEGLAVRLAGPAQVAGGVPFSVQDLLHTALPRESYRKAGHFVAWLLATYGADRFLELYSKSARGFTEPQVSAAFKDILGSEPGEVLALYESSAKDYYPGFGPHACGAGENIPWEGTEATWQVRGSCSQGSVFGVEGSLLKQRWSISVPSTGMYIFDSGNRIAGLRRCLTTSANADELEQSDPAVSNDWSTEESFEPSVHTDPQWEWAEYPVLLQSGVYDVWVLRAEFEDPFLYPPNLSLRAL